MTQAVGFVTHQRAKAAAIVAPRRRKSPTQSKTMMEYVVPLSGRFGQTYQYRLLHTPTNEPCRFLSGLKSVEQLRQEAIGKCGIHLAPTAQVQRCKVQNPLLPSKDNALVNLPANLAPFAGEHICELRKAPVNGAIISFRIKAPFHRKQRGPFDHPASS